MIGLIMAIAAAAASIPITAPGPQGPLAGHAASTPGPSAPVVLIIPGFGPDRPRRQQSARRHRCALPAACRGARRQRACRRVRIDKRGMFGSKAAVADREQGDDRRLCRRHAQLGRRDPQADRTQSASGFSGTAKGALVALAAAQQPDGHLRRHPRRRARAASSATSSASSCGQTRPMRPCSIPRWRRSTRSSTASMWMSPACIRRSRGCSRRRCRTS